MLDAHLGHGAPSSQPGRGRSPGSSARAAAAAADAAHDDGRVPQDAPAFNATNFTPEEIVQPARPVGDDVSAQAWTSAPMTAMNELMRRRRSAPPVNPELYPMTGEVLTQEQIYYLVELCV